ncbi:hypothetical protein [Agaribacter flavus]|uniref:IrrE N-terminal-like domain-containing protein n=1 Tax=Agaribacter flavus TaxID=1902781 RepID=A0ABV7FS46_9ALTE
MSLLIKGFSKQEVIEIDEIARIVKRIPRKHLLGLTAIVFDPSYVYQRSYVEYKPINYRAAGIYAKSPLDHILIHKFKDKSDFTHILLHEVGHHVYTNIITPKQRKLWVTKIYPSIVMPSEYAKKNASEGFSECYAFKTKEISLLLGNL